MTGEIITITIDQAFLENAFIFLCIIFGFIFIVKLISMITDEIYSQKMEREKKECQPYYERYKELVRTNPEEANKYYERWKHKITKASYY